MNVKDTGKTLIIEIDKETELRPSQSGKTLVVASTRGNMPTGVVINGQSLRVGLNAYIPAPNGPSGNNGGGGNAKGGK